MAERPVVLFVCVRNGGKSQLAAALMRHRYPWVEVHSAGTDPGEGLNAEVAAALAELGIGVAGERPKPIDPVLLAAADRVVVLGAEAEVEGAEPPRLERWETDEPSRRGITGMERMRLVRDDVDQRVADLARSLGLGES